MNKKITIFAVILVAIGIVGTISSSIAAVPFVTNYINEYTKKASEGILIYDKKVDIKQLDIDIKDTNVEIKKSDSDKVKIVQLLEFNHNKFTIDTRENLLKLVEKDEDMGIEIEGFGDAIMKMINPGLNKVVIYVPNNLDIKVKSRYGNLILQEKDVLKNQLTFSTVTGEITLTKEVKSLEDLTVSSNSYVNLKLGEILGIKNVNISATEGVYLESMPDDIFAENLENILPNSINIMGLRYAPNINIESIVPVAKKLNIDNKNGTTYLNLPTERYNIKFSLESEQNINFNERKDDNDYNQEKESTKKFNGTLRKYQENKNVYDVNVNSLEINISSI